MNLLMAMLLIIDPNCGAQTDISSLVLVATELEIHDDDYLESGYFRYHYNLSGDIRVLNERWFEFRHVKYISAAIEYPPLELMDKWEVINQDLRKKIELKKKLDPMREDHYNAMIKDIDLCSGDWSWIRTFCCNEYDVVSRRRCLKNAPKVLPPPLPFWRFTSLD